MADSRRYALFSPQLEEVKKSSVAGDASSSLSSLLPQNWQAHHQNAVSLSSPINHPQDISQILLEAQNRWLRPSEVCEILRNYQKFYLTPDPPYKPPGGSLFLFDRKTLRYFRKDGHRWRKKKDGKTVREAHEKLKAGRVDVLHCYYAHGEDNENLQRRCYWMLDAKLEHIVLVHYREVKEGNRCGIPRLSTADNGIVAQSSSPACSTQGNSAAVTTQISYASSPSTADWNGETRSPDFDDAAESGDDDDASASHPGFQFSSLQAFDGTNATESRSFLSDPQSRALPNIMGLDRGSCDPYNVDLSFSGKYMPNELHHTNIGVSQEANSIPNICLSSRMGESLNLSLHKGWSPHSHDASALWPEIDSSNKITSDAYEQKVTLSQTNDIEDSSVKLAAPVVGGNGPIKDGRGEVYGMFPDVHLEALATGVKPISQEQANEGNIGPADGFLVDNQTTTAARLVGQDSNKHHPQQMPIRFQNDSEMGTFPHAGEQPLRMDTEADGIRNNALVNNSFNDEEGPLKKLDSFGRWMSKEIGGDCDDSLMASDSGNYWNTLDNQNGEKEVSSLSHHMQLDIDSMSPSLSQEQLFSIIDFSPEWAYSDVETKVLISGTFLGDSKCLSSRKWSCMFGEVEVSAEVLTSGVIRCHAPPHGPGRVPFYITCSDRLACSEVREFEYRQRPSMFTLPPMMSSNSVDETNLQIRFAKLLYLGSERKWLDCSAENCEKCGLRKHKFFLRSNDKTEWDNLVNSCKSFGRNHQNSRELLVQKLLKDRLSEWLLCKAHEDGKGPNVLDDEGQGAIHLAAALGYEWAMDPIVATGVNPNFRDLHGRTGLHWAAYYGREEAIVSLVSLGAAPGAVEDPTTKFPAGKTAADLASSRGHKGIAGYLAEADLTSHLSSLGLKENAMDTISATIAAEKAMETVEEQSIVPLDRGREDSLSLRGSLAAVRNAAQAAHRIQGAFRVYSFRHRQRQQREINDVKFEVTEEVAALISANRAQKTGHFSDSLHSAALKIQRKFRGWKGRKDFLIIRNRIVKIQAHVRGYQVRKQYRKVIWSVSIVEKAILRWRRKGAGLRGFRAEAIKNVEPEAVKTDEYDFLRLGRKQKAAGVEKALARVQSMVRYPEARDQYMRLVTNFQNTKLGDMGNSQDQPL
ncbi:calmodulin-binding transcription activator 3 isoform X1 [Amborella trichopoda]|uniref:calmodulin-binding transcription activator 3 isoform X1 n=1 Tax=Amborella trichopoda TaxID=13333 RepID=UPI0009BEE699|nr:calmodulin-binding transcription activator 3 isoform X1 [Amborella trichopoda]|eukprot:XP_020520472.1 calmodulin-binding transcription activator 3 isoform X1 [Amborella trichopoda]